MSHINVYDVLTAIVRAAVLSILLAALVSPSAQVPRIPITDVPCDASPPNSVTGLPPTCGLNLRNHYGTDR